MITPIEIGAGIYFLLGAGVGLGELFRAPPWADGSEEIVFALFLIVAWPFYLYRLLRVNRDWGWMAGKPIGGDWPDDSDKEGV